MSAQMMRQLPPRGGWTEAMVECLRNQMMCVPGHDAPRSWSGLSVFEPGAPACLSAQFGWE